MPKITSSTTLEQVDHTAGKFGFSAAKVGEGLGAGEYTLVTIAADRSGSTSGFQQDMEACLQEIVKGCLKSPRAENLMLRLVTFDSTRKEEHGFRLLQDCNLSDYDGVLRPGGMTALYDATIDAVEATGNYGQQLMAADYMANGLVVVITDGCQNPAKPGDLPYVRQAFEEAVKGEKLESNVSILVAVNPEDAFVAQELKIFNDEAGFTEFVKLKDAKANTLAKLAQFISDYTSSQSQALGSGAASAPIDPSIYF